MQHKTTVGKLRHIIREVLTSCPKCGGKGELDFGFYQRPCEKCEGEGKVDDGTPSVNPGAPPAPGATSFPLLPSPAQGARRIFVVDYQFNSIAKDVVLHVIDRSLPPTGSLPVTEHMASYPLDQLSPGGDLTACYDFIEAFAESQNAPIAETSSVGTYNHWDSMGKSGLMDPKRWRENVADETGW